MHDVVSQNRNGCRNTAESHPNYDLYSSFVTRVCIKETEGENREWTDPEEQQPAQVRRRGEICHSTEQHYCEEKFR